MLRFTLFALISLALITCSPDRPPVAPAGKILTSALPAPTNLTTEAITDTSALLIWGRVSGADDYDLFYKPSTVSTWSPISHHGADTLRAISGLISETQYIWTVKADSADQSSDWAVNSRFKTLASTSNDNRSSVTDSFDIEIIFPRPEHFTYSQRLKILKAAREWEQVVVGDMPSYTVEQEMVIVEPPSPFHIDRGETTIVIPKGEVIDDI